MLVSSSACKISCVNLTTNTSHCSVSSAHFNDDASAAHVHVKSRTDDYGNGWGREFSWSKCQLLSERRGLQEKMACTCRHLMHALACLSSCTPGLHTGRRPSPGSSLLPTAAPCWWEQGCQRHLFAQGHSHSASPGWIERERRHE